MPGQSGYEFLRSLQAAGSGRIPVFVVTGSTLDASTISVIKQEGNVVEFIGKPVNVRKFTAALHAHLRTAPK
jgi:DNA-binding response OmpR family regulator